MYNPSSEYKAGNNNNLGNPGTIYNQPSTTAAPSGSLATWSPPKFTLPETAAEAPAPVTANSGRSYADSVLGMQDRLLNNNSKYMQNARQTGLEMASKRGLINSSIAAGNSQRAAIEASAPLLNEAASMYGRDRSAELSNWMSGENQKRDAAYTLAALPIRNTYDMLSGLQRAAIDQPDVYTPSYINSMSNFFTSNMHNVLNNFFGPKGTGG